MFGAHKGNRRHSQWRVHVFAGLVILSAGVIFYRLFDLTYLKHAHFVQIGQSQYNSPAASIAGRGNIYVSDLSNGARHLAATNKNFWYVYANTKNIESADRVAEQLSSVLRMDRATINKILQGKSNYQVLADHLDKETGTRINQLKIKGVTAAQAIDRYYLEGSLFAPVIGFVGSDGSGKSGRYGAEAYYDDTLSGIERTKSLAGNETYASIVRFLKSWFSSHPSETLPALNDGSDIVLTIDKNIQAFAESKLNEALKKWNSPNGSIIVQDPNTGAILAMVGSPSFDPNHYSDYQLGAFPNRTVQDLFEPGSSFKSITMAAGLDSNAVGPETTYEDTGAVKFGTYTIKNFNEKANGLQTMRQALEHSLNTGMIFVENKVGDDRFLNYVVNFGFGQKTGVDLPGEISGNIGNLYSGRKINFATASFGQGVAVTPLQLVNAYSVIANGGKLMKPYVVKEIVKADGSKIETQPSIIGTPITERTSLKMKSMLVDVVEKGYDKARAKGYDLAGKTGTAQIPDSHGGYVGDNQFIHNFVGFAPAYDPKFVILIKMDKPQGIKFAADSLSPVFGDMTRFLLGYFHIPPSHQ